MWHCRGSVNEMVWDTNQTDYLDIPIQAVVMGCQSLIFTEYLSYYSVSLLILLLMACH